MDFDDIQEMMRGAKAKMHPSRYMSENDPGYACSTCSGREKAVALSGDLLIYAMERSLEDWLEYYSEVYPGIALCRSVLAVAERGVDPCGLLPLVQMAMRSLEATRQVDDWVQDAWLSNNNLLLQLFHSSCAAWPEDEDPFEASPRDVTNHHRPSPPKPESGPVLYPHITVGLTSHGINADVRVRPSEGYEGRHAQTIEAIGLACWAMWKAGVPEEDIDKARGRLKSRKTELVMAWIGGLVNVDGDGLAGIQRYEALVNPPHPWAGILRDGEEKALCHSVVLCDTEEQGMLLAGGLEHWVWMIPVRIGSPEGMPEPVRSEMSDLHASIRNCIPGMIPNGQKSQRHICTPAHDCETILKTVNMYQRGGGGCLVVGCEGAFPGKEDCAIIAEPVVTAALMGWSWIVASPTPLLIAAIEKLIQKEDHGVLTIVDLRGRMPGMASAVSLH